MKPENMDNLKMKRPGIQHEDRIKIKIKIKIMKPEIIVSDHCYTPNSRCCDDTKFLIWPWSIKFCIVPASWITEESHCPNALPLF